MGTLLHSCAEVHAVIELSFEVVKPVSIYCHPRQSCIRWSLRASRGRDGFWGRLPHWPNGFNGVFCNKNVFSSCVKN